MWQAAFVTLAMLAALGAASAEERFTIETVSESGMPSVAHTWGYSTPKLLCDGKQLYAVSLDGQDMHHGHIEVHWRDAHGWHAGAKLEPVYQPATILLDGAGHINVFCTGAGTRAYHWRSKRPHDVTDFAEVPLSKPETFRFGYLGVGTDGKQLALAGLDGGYSMWLAVKPSLDAPWGEPHIIARGATGAPTGNKAPCYPILIPAGDRIHIVYSVSPDGSVHNTYNEVVYACFDNHKQRITRRDTIAVSQPGVMTYGLDALRAPDGTLYSLYFTNIHIYGEKPEGIDARKGLYLAILPPGGRWTSTRVTDSTGTGQLFRSHDGSLHVIESSSLGARDHVSHDGGGTFRLLTQQAWPGNGGFLYLLKPNSGSVTDDVFRGLQSVPNMVDGKATDNRLQYVEYRPSR